jgi:hypothetical protein
MTSHELANKLLSMRNVDVVIKEPQGDDFIHVSPLYVFYDRFVVNIYDTGKSYISFSNTGEECISIV